MGEVIVPLGRAGRAESITTTMKFTPDSALIVKFSGLESPTYCRRRSHCYSNADPLSCSPLWLKAAAWSL
jgi:hypothetical protein